MLPCAKQSPCSSCRFRNGLHRFFFLLMVFLGQLPKVIIMVLMHQVLPILVHIHTVNHHQLTPISNLLNSSKMCCWRQIDDFNSARMIEKRITDFWSRYFGYAAIKNPSDAFEHMDKFIACFKWSITSLYTQNSRTKYSIQHTDRYYRLARCNPSVDRANHR